MTKADSDEPLLYVDVAKTLYENGYHPTPCRGKNPNIAGPGWNKPLAEERLADMMLEYGWANTGIVCGDVVGLDVDIKDHAEASIARRIAAEVLPPELLVRVGEHPKFLLLGKSDGSVAYAKSAKVEVFATLGGGHPKGQFVVFGEHEDTGLPYEWETKSPLHVALTDLPILSHDAVHEFLRRLDAEIGTSTLPKYLEAYTRATQLPSAPPGNVTQSILGRAFSLAGLTTSSAPRDEKYYVRCPWESEHTTASNGTDTVVFAPPANFTSSNDGPGLGRFHCSHAHCTGSRSLADVLQFFDDQQPGVLDQARTECSKSASTSQPEKPGGGDWNALEAAFADLEHRPPPVPTGIAGLDKALGGGVRPGDFIGLSGQAGSNKTALLLTLAVNAARKDSNVIYLSCELDRAEIAARIYARYWFETDSDVPTLGFRDLLDRRDLKSGLVEDTKLITRNARNDLSARVTIQELPDGATDRDVRDFVEHVQQADPMRPLIVMIDPIQRLYASPSGARGDGVAYRMNSDDVQRTSQVAFAMKRLASEKQIAILFASDATMAAHNQLRARDKKTTAPDTVFRGSYAINNAITAGFSLIPVDGPEEANSTGSERWATADPSVHAFQSSKRATELGHCWGVLRAIKNRQGKRLRVLLNLVPGASAVYDAEERLR